MICIWKPTWLPCGPAAEDAEADRRRASDSSPFYVSPTSEI